MVLWNNGAAPWVPMLRYYDMGPREVVSGVWWLFCECLS